MRNGGRAWIVDGLVLAGVAGCLGLIAVTAMVNFRFGYKLGGNDAFERELFAWGLGCADVVKALMPFAFALAVRKKDVLAAVASASIFAVGTASSFYAGTGLAAEHRLANEGGNTSVIDKRADLKAEKERFEARLKVLGPLPSPAEVTRSIEAELAKPVARTGKTVATYSSKCQESLTRTRDACRRVAALAVTFEQATEADGAEARIKELVGDLGGLDSNIQSADPQLDVLERVAKWLSLKAGRDDIRTGLLLFLGLLLELGSGLGLYAVTTPWRHREQGPEGKRMTSTLGDAVVYADERLQPVRGSRLTANKLYADYEAWCGKRNYVPVREGIFTEQMIMLAKDVGMPLEQSGSNLEFCDVGLVGNL